MTSQRAEPVLAIRADLDALSIKQQNDQVRPVAN
ncbi:MAG: amidohydrolase [Moorea sp. SIO2I5]|nr:amidohydrolase [Moorena sp. SIO2I5]